MIPFLVTKTSTLESILSLLGMIVVFILILVACVYTTKLVGNKQLKRKKLGNFRLIETYVIAQNMYLQIIQIAGHFFVISVTKNSIEKITELSEDEVVELKQEGISASMNFSKILAGFTKKRSSDE